MLSAEPSQGGEEGEEDRGGATSHSIVDVPLNTASHHQHNEEPHKKSINRTDFQCFHRVVYKDVGSQVRASTGQPTGEKPAASLTWSFKSQNRQPSDEKESSELSLRLVPTLYVGKGRSEVLDTTTNGRNLPPIQSPSPTCTMSTTSENYRPGDLDKKTSPFTSTQPLDTTTTLSSTSSADPSSSALHPTNSPIAPTFPLTAPSPLNHTDSLVMDPSLTSTTLVYDSQRNNIGSSINGDVTLGSTRPTAETDAHTHSFPSSSCLDGFSERANPPPVPPLTTEIQHHRASSAPAACTLPVPPTSFNLVAHESQKKSPNTQDFTLSLSSIISERDQLSSLTSPRSTAQTLVSSESNSSKRKRASVANDDGQQPSSDDSDEASDSNANRGSLAIQMRNKKMKSTDCLLFAATLLEQDTTASAPESKGRHVGNSVDKSLQVDQDNSSFAVTKLSKRKKKNPDPRTLASVAAQVLPASKNGGVTGGNLTKPREADVLCGRGGLINKHAGNIAYRKVVDYNKPYYQSVEKKHRILVSQSIVQTILNNGGRFLILGSRGGTWMEIGFKRAVQKTSQALRERTIAPDEGQQEDGDEDNNESIEEGGDGTMESGDERDHCDWQSDHDE
jgi:hypothetical protein